MANLTDADKVLRNDTGKDIVTQLTAIKTAIENGGGGGGGGASTVSQLTDVLLSSTIPDGDVLVRDNNLTGGKLWKNKTITVELTQAEYNQLVADDEVLPDVNYYIIDAPSMQGSSKDLSYDGTTKSVYTKIGEVESDVSDLGTNKADKTELVKFFDLTVSSSVSDSGISPFSFYGQPTKTDSNIHNILSVTVIDTQFNNPAIAVLYGQSGSTFTFMVYSARSGNVKIRVAYN